MVILYACQELQRVNDNIPSILYGSLVPIESPLYQSLKEQREEAKANVEAGLIDLDGYMGKVGSISLFTGKSKFSADDEEEDDIVMKRKKVATEDEPEPAKKKRKVGAALHGLYLIFLGQDNKDSGQYHLLCQQLVREQHLQLFQQ